MGHERKTALALSEEDREIFWSRVDRRGPDECWLWTGGRDPKGYGQFYRGRTKYRANRAVLELLTGRPLGDLLSCHRCDNPPCCNPAHLFIGTISDNTRDAFLKGRLPQAFAKGTYFGKPSRPAAPSCGHAPKMIRKYPEGLRCAECRSDDGFRRKAREWPSRAGKSS
jgi:hypothetical protein